MKSFLCLNSMNYSNALHLAWPCRASCPSFRSFAISRANCDLLFDGIKINANRLMIRLLSSESDLWSEIGHGQSRWLSIFAHSPIPDLLSHSLPGVVNSLAFLFLLPAMFNYSSFPVYRSHSRELFLLRFDYDCSQLFWMIDFAFCFSSV